MFRCFRTFAIGIFATDINENRAGPLISLDYSAYFPTLHSAIDMELKTGNPLEKHSEGQDPPFVTE